ncbi:MAG TPA: NAD(P)-dependent alcohol dehydrogenase [Phototrophicaceae bacterium]|jgi:NADPH:quinone reductase-like Zn-dependent oxidoreductase|nr:NAD(P)-dependent alcohol dehydrogenase [Phototrophicaceae bacterium]
MPGKMKAILAPQYGPASVLILQEVEQPTPKDNGVLINVRAASLNPYDWHRMIGSMRKEYGEPVPTDPSIGTDMAGVVVAVGKNVTDFKPGDEVFGRAVGSFAEYACSAERSIVHKPSNVSFEEAAAVPIAGLTALQGLRVEGQIKAGQRVLVNGAAGGVGTFAVQIARAFDTHVTAVCSTGNLELARSTGADEVIDYTAHDFTEVRQQYDLILDTIGNHSVDDYERCLKPDGVCVLVGATQELRAQMQVRTGLDYISMMVDGYKPLEGMPKIFPMLTNPKKDDLMFLAKLLESRKIVPVIGKVYRLEQTADAMELLATKHARGKLVISMC